MKPLNRHGFLKLAGTGSAAVAASQALPGAGVLAAAHARQPLTFRAVAQLPAKPMAGYASCVLTGHIDVAAHTGTLSQTIFAGPPEAMSAIGLPGLSRTIRVTDVRDDGGALHITGIVDDRSQLDKDENPRVAMRIDLTQRTVTAQFGASEVRLHLESE